MAYFTVRGFGPVKEELLPLGSFRLLLATEPCTGQQATIRKMVEKAVTHRWGIPEFQRGFIWTPERNIAPMFTDFRLFTFRERLHNKKGRAFGGPCWWTIQRRYLPIA
jgi:hypothetical protein